MDWNEMSERETPQAIHDSAVAWVVRLDRSGDDPQARAELDAWLAGDKRRQGAFFRAQAAWRMLDRASALRGGQRNEGPQDVDRSAWLSRRKVLWGGGMAAASVAAIVSGVALWPRSATQIAGERIETALGEIRRVPLSDGSLAAVNTQTKLAVRIEPEVRHIALDQGEAWFQVAKDRARPFIVEAGEARVKAVGTAFSVRRTDDGADVQVTEGVVEVWKVGDEGNVRRVSAGARTFVSDATGPAPVVEASIEIDRTLAWRNGQLIFDGDTLGEAAAEFNRYNRVKVEVADPALAGEKMIGRFRTNEPDAFARAAAGLLGARVDISADRIVLSRI
ncbi:FecR family protein [Sphingosinicella microcystinivorans]|uniref:FecR family protein n=1 Tax=Sphingosinicella microcystinivorans TaxID=335406 RepID=A0AAD1G262_SPHMI|nr:FecR domain-containing protein [Sphingosinicella microcystinivorans]RKS94304.1 FecR family protein [Sphingosinicella microcystinivorans]BBE35276.1 iron dicitrate transporter FecR [Sphingosinicella microcystinivorans]